MTNSQLKSVKTGWHKVCNIVSERRFKKRMVKTQRQTPEDKEPEFKTKQHV